MEKAKPKSTCEEKASFPLMLEAERRKVADLQKAYDLQVENNLSLNEENLGLLAEKEAWGQEAERLRLHRLEEFQAVQAQLEEEQARADRLQRERAVLIEANRLLHEANGKQLTEVTGDYQRVDLENARLREEIRLLQRSVQHNWWQTERANCAKLLEVNKQLQEANANQRVEIQRLEKGAECSKELKRYQQELEILQSKFESHSRHIDQCEERIRSSEIIEDELRKELCRLRDSTAIDEAMHRGRGVRCTGLEAENKELRAGIASRDAHLETVFANKREQAHGLMWNMVEFGSEVIQLRNKVSELAHLAGDQQAELSLLRSANVELEARLEASWEGAKQDKKFIREIFGDLDQICTIARKHNIPF